MVAAASAAVVGGSGGGGGLGKGGEEVSGRPRLDARARETNFFGARLPLASSSPIARPQRSPCTSPAAAGASAGPGLPAPPFILAIAREVLTQLGLLTAVFLSGFFVTKLTIKR